MDSPLSMPEKKNGVGNLDFHFFQAKMKHRNPLFEWGWGFHTCHWDSHCGVSGDRVGNLDIHCDPVVMRHLPLPAVVMSQEA